MTLHILSQPPSHNAYKSCLEHLASDDILVLINDGVYALQIADDELNDKVRANKVFALKDDAQSRGISAQPKTHISYEKFVELSCAHSPSQSWY